MADSSDSPDVTDITIDRPAGVIRLAFDGGLSGDIDLTEMRLACPCAGCRSARQGGSPAWAPGPSGAAPEVRDAELVGGWGLSITWNDGHSTGIYPFSSLAEWVRNGRPTLTPDSGLAG